jgi:predicted dehydrogenase
MISRRELLLSAGAAAPLRFDRKIRVGVIGFDGHVGEITAPLPLLPDVRIQAYAAPAPSKAEEFRGARHYLSHAEMLAQEDLDVVAVLTDDGARADAILAALSRKRHVIAEKPLAMTRADLDRVRKAAAGAGVRLSMLLPARFLPHFQALKQIVAAGEIGEPAMVTGQKSYRPGVNVAWRNRKESYSGTIPWVGIHMADLMMWTAGRPFVECVAYQARVGWPQLGPRENSAAVLFRMDNGGSAALTMDYLRPGTAETHDDDRLRLAGTEGVAEYLRATGVTVVTTKSKSRVVALGEPKFLFADFLDSVYNGKPALLPEADIWRANEVVLAARDSANTGRAVKL